MEVAAMILIFIHVLYFVLTWVEKGDFLQAFFFTCFLALVTFWVILQKIFQVIKGVLR
jgi:hypothetical protein